MIIFRIFAVLVGTGIVAAATHVAVEMTGGYTIQNSPLPLAIAAGVIVGSICIGAAWSDRRWFLVIAFGTTLLAGEVFGMINTGERIVSTRDAAGEPARLLALRRKETEKKLDEARNAHIETTARLEAALRSKTVAESAVATQASARSCLSNCRELLNKAVDDASREVSAARTDLEERQRAAKDAVAVAQAAVDALPPPKSETPFADRIGWKGWALDLFSAALASLSANGLGATLIAFGAHSHRPQNMGKSYVKTNSREISDAQFWPAADDKVIHRSHPSIEGPSGKAGSSPAAASIDWEPVLPMPEELTPAPRAIKTLAVKTATERLTGKTQVAAFLRTALEPALDGTASLRNLYTAYLTWCSVQGVEPLPAAELGKHLKSIVDKIGLDCEAIGRDVVVRGAVLKGAA